MSFIIAVDSNCDLPASYIETHHIHLFPITVTIDGKELVDDLGATYSHDDFYESLRNGAMPTTAQVNSFTFKEQFEKWAQEGTDVIYISLSSGLSGTYGSAIVARNEVLETYPNAKISVVDSLAVSGGHGLLIDLAIKQKEAGISLDEIEAFLEKTKHLLVHAFTVDDLKHLYRGGRLSATSALMGSLLQVKPVLCINEEGLLKPHSKFRGRKKALKALIDQFQALTTDYTQTINITHADCLDDAQFIADTLKETFGCTDIMITKMGTTITSHAGLNTIAIFFVGTQKSLIN